MTTPSTALAREVVTALIAAGVTEVVIAPGSRNAPLSFAVYDAAEAGLLRLHTRIDERSAGFLALGLTRGGARAAVMSTSGTAVANLHPAVLEAAHAGLPVVVVTADRPARLRGTNANQTTDQVGIFGRLVETLDLTGPLTGPAPVGLSESLATRTAPVHLNVQLDEPLVPDGRWAPAVERAEWSRQDPRTRDHDPRRPPHRGGRRGRRRSARAGPGPARAGRCSRSRPAARARARTRCAATGCCSTPSSASGSSAWSCSGTRPCPAR